MRYCCFLMTLFAAGDVFLYLALGNAPETC